MSGEMPRRQFLGEDNNMTQDCLYLRRLKKYGNFTKAAESLGVSQPYFSQKIARLEKNYKVPLVDRHTLPVTLTRAGELVLATEQRIYELREDCNKQILDLQAGTRGSVALGASPACMECLLPLALPQLAANLPEITVTVREGNPEALRRLASDGSVDFSLLLATGGTSELDTISVREENILVAVPATAPRFSAIAARPGGKTVSFRELVVSLP